MQVIRRSKLERYRDILRVVANFGPVRQTHIMYKANLTWEGLKEDLGFLKSLNTVREAVNEDGMFYQITELGLKVLAHFSGIESLLKVENRQGEMLYGRPLDKSAALLESRF